MFKRVVFCLPILFAFQSTLAFDGIRYEVTCEEHFAATKLVEKITLRYKMSVINIWSNEIEAEVVLAEREGMAPWSGTHKAYFDPGELDVYADPYNGTTVFKPCSLFGEYCDYDAVKINLVNDDELGFLATLYYFSDGPSFFQVLKCKSNKVRL